MSGFTIDTVYALGEADGFVYKHVNVANRRRRRRLRVETENAVHDALANSTRGALVRAMASLNFLSYSKGTGSTAGGDARSDGEASFAFVLEQVEPVYERGDAQNYITRGKAVDASTAMFEAIPQWWQSYRAAYSADGQALRYIQLPRVPDGEAFDASFGAFAMLYKDDEGRAVVVFRGTYSRGDTANVAHFIAGWFADRTPQGMRRTWEHFAEENGRWEKAELAREGVLATLSRGLLAIGISMQLGGFAAQLHARSPAISEAAFSRLGYWPLHKALADRLLDEDVGSGETVYFSGQSQGGAIAALLSMYVEKSRGREVETVTFAGLGGACWARELGWPDQDGANLLADVDPYTHHPQITDYSDAYDVWGNMDVDPGSTCYYGVDRARPAFSYCKPIQGYGGAFLTVTTSNMFRRLAGYTEASAQFAQCRMLTHSMPTILSNLVDPSRGYLREDGSTDGGCSPGGAYGGIPSRADPDGICAPGRFEAELPGIYAGIAFSVLAVVLVPVAACALLCFWKGRCCFSYRRRRTGGGDAAATLRASSE